MLGLRERMEENGSAPGTGEASEARQLLRKR